MEVGMGWALLAVMEYPQPLSCSVLCVDDNRGVNWVRWESVTCVMPGWVCPEQ